MVTYLGLMALMDCWGKLSCRSFRSFGIDSVEFVVYVFPKKELLFEFKWITPVS